MDPIVAPSLVQEMSPPPARLMTPPKITHAAEPTPEIQSVPKEKDLESTTETLIVPDEKHHYGPFACFLSKYHSLVIVLFFGALVMPGCIVALLTSWFFPKLKGEKPVKVVGGVVLCSLALLELYLSACYGLTFLKKKGGLEKRATAFAVWAGLTGITFCVLLTSMLFVSALVKPIPTPPA